MKNIGLFLAMLSCCAVAPAQENAPAAATAPASAMAKAIEQTNFITAHKPSTEAKYYMFLCSASWCSPCRYVMPKIVKEYPNMMANKDVEIILLGLDRSPEFTRKYLEKYNAPFAALQYKSDEGLKLPGFPRDIMGIPHIVVVDAEGKLLYRGHAMRYADWKTEIEKKK